jgi:hypothetical protein
LAALLALLLPAGAGAAPTWLLPPLTLSAAGENAIDPQVALDPQGNAVGVWTRSDGLNNRIEAASRPSGGAFGAAQILSAAGENASGPQPALDPQGNALAVWQRFDGSDSRIEAASRPSGGAFGAAQILSAAGENAFEPQVALDPQGNALAVWRRLEGSDFRIEAASRPPGGAFGPAQILSAPGQDATEPQVALDPQGNALAVWTRSDGSNFRIEAASRPPGGAFGPAQTLSAPGQSAFGPQPALDPQGNALAVWRRFDGSNIRIEAASRPPGGAFFGAAQILSAAGQNTFEPQVALAPQGNALAVWQRFDGSDFRIEAASRPPGGAFGPAQILSAPGQSAFGPQPALDPQGNALAVWQRSDGSDFRVQAAPYDAAAPELRDLRIPAAGTVGEALHFSVSPFDVWSPASTEWSFGDGAKAAGAGAIHTYTAPGSYTVGVTATDAVGNSAAAGATVSIGAPPAAPAASAPRLSALALSPRRFRAAPRGPSTARRGRGPIGATVSYRLSKPAAVRFTVQRALVGRRAGRRCVKPRPANRRAKRCIRHRALRGFFAQSGKAGRNAFRFRGRLGPRKLAPGRYRLRAVAGSRSAPRHAAFTILRRKPPGRR